MKEKRYQRIKKYNRQLYEEFIKTTKSPIFWIDIIPILAACYLALFYKKTIALESVFYSVAIFICCFILGTLMRYEGHKIGEKEYFQAVRLSITNAEEIITQQQESKLNIISKDEYIDNLTKNYDELANEILLIKEQISQFESNNILPTRDSDHYLYPPNKRDEIAEKWLAVKDTGKVRSKEGWAKTNYGITAKTLNNYVNDYLMRNQNTPQ